jgi:hypothetical protein
VEFFAILSGPPFPFGRFPDVTMPLRLRNAGRHPDA